MPMRLSRSTIRRLVGPTMACSAMILGCPGCVTSITVASPTSWAMITVSSIAAMVLCPPLSISAPIVVMVLPLASRSTTRCRPAAAIRPSRTSISASTGVITSKVVSRRGARSRVTVTRCTRPPASPIQHLARTHWIDVTAALRGITPDEIAPGTTDTSKTTTLATAPSDAGMVTPISRRSSNSSSDRISPRCSIWSITLGDSGWPMSTTRTVPSLTATYARRSAQTMSTTGCEPRMSPRKIGSLAPIIL